jgi:hypothetical protein
MYNNKHTKKMVRKSLREAAASGEEECDARIGTGTDQHATAAMPSQRW